ncbi:hypothetical protein EG240_07970 [Paenimyroides tangerinum]|uniref:Carboxypeptidase-like regulatory domain-containing protein n=1 Tax=Paenimyroides tangerinum TaxID=2488728 RepID=A0A3P3W649_9FLAO|nr:hypothetical protein [Paenimyroides tangerinum]RRJ90621.1 hypothetical protein EG240_07970 [Paenimyroides tangerinum]
MRKFLYFIFIILSWKSFSQELIQGKLLLEDHTTIKLTVYNKNSKESIETDSRGVFQMKMSENDTLVFFQNETIFDEYIVPEVVIKSKSLRYYLKKEGTTLNELVIDRGPLFNFGTKPKSKDEKLEHQNSIKPVFENSTGVTLDGVFNRISGRNKTIKKVIAFEKAEINFKALKQVYPDEVLVNEFKVPEENINMFVYFLVNEDDFNKDLISLHDPFKYYLISKVVKFKKEYEL